MWGNARGGWEVDRLVKGKCLFACMWVVCVYCRSHRHRPCVHFSGKKTHHHLSTHTHTHTNWPLCANPVCMLTLTLWMSTLFFSPEPVDRPSFYWAHLTSMQGLHPHNHLHPKPFLPTSHLPPLSQLVNFTVWLTFSEYMKHVFRTVSINHDSQLQNKHIISQLLNRQCVSLFICCSYNGKPL